MAITRRKLSELIPYRNNPRTHPPKQIEQLAGLIKKFGFHDSHAIAVDEEGIIIWGHGRLEAAKLAGKDEVPVEVLTGLSDAEKQTLRIADNGIAEQSDWDMDALARELAELDDADISGDLLSLGDELLEQLEDVDSIPEFDPIGADAVPRLDQKSPITCPNCQHEFIPD